MINLTDEIQDNYDKDLVKYFALIKELNEKSKASKEVFFAKTFEPFPENGNIEDKIEFLLQFFDLLPDFVLFPDEEIIKKLRELKFAKHTLKWIVKLEDITDEIDRLRRFNGLFFMPFHYLFSIQAHLVTKFLISTIEDFDFTVKRNNQDTNILYEDIAKRFRKREYNRQLGQTQKMDSFERMMNSIINKMESAPNNNTFVKKILEQSCKGNTAVYYTQLKEFHNQGVSKRKIYLELFPLLKMIMKENDLLSKEEFLSTKEDSYDGDYSKYKIARVKKILQIK
jgi:hypothetical protein